MQESVEAFWANFEKETGEKVLAKTMGQYFSTPKDRGDWGLIVLSPTALRFRKTPSENWFASMFKASSVSVPTKSEADLVIPYASISKISTPSKKFLDFLFGSPYLVIIVSFQNEDGDHEGRFAVDPKGDFHAKLMDLAKKI